MIAYALSLTPLLSHLKSVKRSVKHVAFANDLTGAGKLKEIKIWWDTLITEGPNYGYYPKPSKLSLILKHHYKEYADRIIVGSSNIKITTEGTRHLDAILGKSVSKKNISETKYSHEKINEEYFQRPQIFNHKLLILHICQNMTFFSNTNSRFSYEQYLI